jgi:acyl-CoA thioester hydrolase
MEIKIYYQDTDCGGVVYYANYLVYFERDRTEWLEKKGISIKELAGKGILFVVARAEVDYKSPAYYGETLEVTTELGSVGSVRFELHTKIEEKSTGRLVVAGKCTMVCVGKNFKPHKLPEEVRNLMGQVSLRGMK